MQAMRMVALIDVIKDGVAGIRPRLSGGRWWHHLRQIADDAFTHVTDAIPLPAHQHNVIQQLALGMLSLQAISWTVTWRINYLGSQPFISLCCRIQPVNSH